MSADYATLKKFSNIYKNIIDNYIINEINVYPDVLRESASYLIKLGGKRLRPLITLLIARQIKGPGYEFLSLPLAVSIEFVHNFTLIHDDIIDNDEMRRGHPTTHKVFGENYAILAGDLLHNFSYSIIIKLLKNNISYKIIIEALDILSDTIKKLCEGESLELVYDKQPLDKIQIQDYLQVIYLKTGALIEAAAKLGALAVSDKHYYIDIAGEYGKLLGMAFQIRDDYLNIFGNPRITGKPAYSDIRNKKKTILIIYTYQNLSSNKSTKFINLFNKNNLNSEEIRELVSLIEESGAKEYAINLAKKYSNSAIELINNLPINDIEANKALVELAEYAISREK